MSLAQAVEDAWLRLWEKLASYIPLPRGLADFALSLIISIILVLIYRYNKRLCYAVVVSMAGAILLSAMLLYTSLP